MAKTRTTRLVLLVLLAALLVACSTPREQATKTPKAKTPKIKGMGKLPQELYNMAFNKTGEFGGPITSLTSLTWKGLLGGYASATPSDTFDRFLVTEGYIAPVEWGDEYRFECTDKIQPYVYKSECGDGALGLILARRKLVEITRVKETARDNARYPKELKVEFVYILVEVMPDLPDVKIEFDGLAFFLWNANLDQWELSSVRGLRDWQDGAFLYDELLEHQGR